MARITIIGAGVCGLLTGTLLAKDGHEVTVLERDPAGPLDTVEASWSSWERRGVGQFRLLHFLQPRFRQEAENALPEVLAELEALGAIRYGLDRQDLRFTGGPRPGDEEFIAITARRPIIEMAVARVAARTAGLTVRRGTPVAGLVASGNGTIPPHVTGVRLESGEELTSDLVVDAAGRRSAIPRFLEEIGAAAMFEEEESLGLTYYGRHFASDDGEIPDMRGPILTGCGTISLLTLPADNGTWGLGLLALSSDKSMRSLKEVDAWERVFGSVPHVAHWLTGRSITDGVAVIAAVPDRIRSLVVDGAPVATGVTAVADSWSCTNPSVGRGITIGFLHALCLRDTMRDVGLEDQTGFANALHDATAASVEPWFRLTLDIDRSRSNEMEALREFGAYEPTEPREQISQAFSVAAWLDPDVHRAFNAIGAMISAPPEVLQQPGLLDKVLGFAGTEMPFELPSRERLLELAG